jgi:hypothetical protein
MLNFDDQDSALGIRRDEYCDMVLADLRGNVEVPVTSFISFVVVYGVFGMIGSIGNALGEEIGWRGFLVPGLTAYTSSYTKPHSSVY